MTKRPKLLGIPIKQFVEGQYFICLSSNNVIPGAYVHESCANAYFDEKNKRLKEIAKLEAQQTQ